MAAATTQLHQFIMPAAPATATRAENPGLFARFVSALQDARMRQVDREVGLFIERRGGRLTDDLERQIERNFI